MSTGSPNPADVKMLPASSGGGAGAGGNELPAARPAGGVIPSNQPSRQLSDLPKDELDNLAEEYGLDPTDFRNRQHLVTAIHERRQMIAAMDREAMLDVIKWGRRPVTFNATKEQIAQEIVRIRSMKFAGLSQRGLIVLALMRGLPAANGDPVPVLIRRLKRQEGLFAKLNRKRRAMLGSIVSNMIGDTSVGDYQYLPPQQGPTASSTTTAAPPPPPGTIKD